MRSVDDTNNLVKRSGPTDHPADREQMRRAWRTLSVIGFAGFFSSLSISALTVAVPTVVRHFDASSAAGNWLVLGPLLTTTVLMLVFGRLADIFGRRTLYLTGLAVFTVGSLLSGAAPGPWWLVTFRMLQAAGFAMLLTNSAALVTDAFPRHRLGEGMGIYLASFSTAQLVGPTLGGLLAEHAGWRWLFWFSVPIGLLCLMWGIVALRPAQHSTRRGQSLDLTGTVLILSALTCGLSAMSQASAVGWTHPAVLAGFGVALALIPAVVWVERRTDNPVVDLSLFTQRPFTFGLLAGFFNAGAQAGLVLLMALYFQSIDDVSPSTAGMMVLPVAIASVLASVASGRVQPRFSAETLATAGSAVMVVGFAVLWLGVHRQSPYAVLACALAACGFGSGLFMPTNTTAVLRELPSDRLGIANSLRLMLMNSGFVVGTAVTLTALTSALTPGTRKYVLAGTVAQIGESERDRLILGYERAVGTGIVITVLTVMTTVAAGRRATSRRAITPDPRDRRKQTTVRG